MSNKEYHRAQIDKYLKGKLDARAMHRLEREAQNDPFLMDALDGYEANGKDQQVNLSELQQRLTDRITPEKERSILLWRVLPIAAALLLMIGIGYWELIPKPESNKQIASLIKPQPQVNQPAVVQPEIKEASPKPKNISATRSIPPVARNRELPESAKQEATVAIVPVDKKITFSEDTVDYRVAAYKVKKNEKVDNLLKKIEGIDVGADGSVTSQGQAVTKVRVNGKDFMGGDVKQATKNLPADIIEKIQVIDDYGDQAAKTGVKSGEPQKILNITTNKIAGGKIGGKDSLLADKFAKIEPQLREVAINKPNSIMIRGLGKNESNKQSDSSITRALEGRVADVAVSKAKVVANKKVTGRVVDKNNGQPLPGAVIKVNGDNSSAVTSVNGEFTIKLPAAEQTLTATYIGYQQREIVVKNQDKLNIELLPSDVSLNEVVVVGYGSQNKRNVTSALSTVNAPGSPDKAAHPAIGQKAYKNYLQQNSKVASGNTGKVKLAFTIEAVGKINNIRVIKSSNPVLNQRAIDLIQKGPVWVGAKNGKAKEITVKVKFHE